MNLRDLSNPIVIVAHPDDEILFFSSIITPDTQIIICYSQSSDPRLTQGRTKVKQSFPLANTTFLDLSETNLTHQANWAKPLQTESGLNLTPSDQTRFAEAKSSLKQLLAPRLNSSNSIFTHNPWGEYGNEEHVLLFHALSDLKREIGFELFVSGYVSDKSWPLMQTKTHLLQEPGSVAQTNLPLAHALKDLYIEHYCWTWMNSYVWPQTELFYRVDPSRTPSLQGNQPTATPPLSHFTTTAKSTKFRRFLRRAVPVKLRDWLRSLI